MVFKSLINAALVLTLGGSPLTAVADLTPLEKGPVEAATQLAFLQSVANEYDGEAKGLEKVIHRALVIGELDSILDLAYSFRGYVPGIAANAKLSQTLIAPHINTRKAKALKAFFTHRSLESAQAVLDAANSPRSRALGYMCMAEAHFAQNDVPKALMYSVLSLAYDFTKHREEQAKLYLTGSRVDDISLEGSREEVIERLNARAQTTWNPNTFHRFFIMASVLGLLPEFPYSKSAKAGPPTEPIHICIALDDNYVYHAAVVLLSGMLSATPTSQYAFHIIEDPESTSLITDKHRELLKGMVAEMSSNRFTLTFDKFDLKILPEYVLQVGTQRWPRTILLRPYYAYFYPHLSRLLSLDGDMIIMQDLTALYNTDLEGKLLLGSRDIDAGKHLERLELPPSAVYINGGMVLFDTEALRRRNLKRTFDTLLAPGSEFIRKVRITDQDIYPVALEGQIIEIDAQGTSDSRWNWYYEIENRSAWRQINLSHFGIIHLAGRSRKPWNRKSSPFMWAFFPWKNDGVQNLYWVLRSLGPWPS